MGGGRDRAAKEAARWFLDRMKSIWLWTKESIWIPFALKIIRDLQNQNPWKDSMASGQKQLCEQAK